MSKKISTVIIISGPTGSGESTITQKILERLSNIERIVSATTRKPRPNEKNGVDYHFVSEEKFLKMIKTGELLEHIYEPIRGVYYGTVKKEVEKKLAKKINLIANLEIAGLQSLKLLYPGHVTSIFIKPDHPEKLRTRLIERDPTISKEEVDIRVKQAENELKDAKYFDHIVKNEYGKIDEAVAETEEIIRKELSNRGH